MDGNSSAVTPTWEKIVGFAGFVVLCAGLVYLVWAAMTEENSAPKIAFKVQAIKSLDSNYLVTVEVSNRGHESVAALQIEGELEQAAGEPEKSSAQIDYVPSQSRRHVGLFFRSDPKDGKISFRALGYQEP